MNEFEFLFSLLGLLFGFVLVEVLSGFVRTLKAGRVHSPRAVPSIRIGRLSLLLGVFVLLDVTSYWGLAWQLRGVLPLGPDTIFASVLIAGAYYYAASMVFPGDLEEWPNLDEWFWLNRRRVLLCILVVNAITVTAMAVLKGPVGPPWLHVIEQSIYFVPLALAAISQNRWLVGGALGTLIFVYALTGVGAAALRVM